MVVVVDTGKKMKKNEENEGMKKMGLKKKSAER